MLSKLFVYLLIVSYTSHNNIANNTGLSLMKRRGERRRGIFESHSFYIMEKICGIYKITNPKGKVYIGQSKNMHKRKILYKNMLCKGQKRLYASLKKYGLEKHKFEIIARCTIDELNDYEKFYIDLYDATGKNGMNIKGGGDCIYSFSDETKKKLSDIFFGIPKGSSKSKYIGVTCNKYGWIACFPIKGEGKKKISTFDDELSAAYAYDIYMLENYGNSVPLNFTEEERLLLKNKVSSRRIREKRKSKYMGVTKIKDNIWRSSIKVNRKTFHIGNYETEIDAAIAYDLYIIENNLNKNNLNFTEEFVSNKKPKKRKRKTSKYTGVAKAKNKWIAYASLNKKQIHIGTFNSETEAIKARNKFILENNIKTNRN